MDLIPGLPGPALHQCICMLYMLARPSVGQAFNIFNWKIFILKICKCKRDAMLISLARVSVCQHRTNFISSNGRSDRHVQHPFWENFSLMKTMVTSMITELSQWHVPKKWRCIFWTTLCIQEHADVNGPNNHFVLWSWARSRDKITKGLSLMRKASCKHMLSDVLEVRVRNIVSSDMIWKLFQTSDLKLSQSGGTWHHPKSPNKQQHTECVPRSEQPWRVQQDPTSHH